MRLALANKPSWIIQPAVSMTMAYGGVIACWFIFISTTLRFPSIFHEGPYYLIETPAYWMFSVSNLVLFMWLLWSFSPARKAALDVRRGQLGGIVCSLIFVAALQTGAQALHHDLNTTDHTDPVPVAAFIEGQTAEQQTVIACIREGLNRSHPELREALTGDVLVYQVGGKFGCSLKVSPAELQLSIYGLPLVTNPIGEGPWTLEVNRQRASALLVIQPPLDSAELDRLRSFVVGLPQQGA